MHDRAYKQETVELEYAREGEGEKVGGGESREGKGEGRREVVERGKGRERVEEGRKGEKERRDRGGRVQIHNHNIII